MAVDKKFFVDINLQGNALNNATIGSNSDMTKGGSFRFDGSRLEYYDGSSTQSVANLADIAAVTGGLILQGGYDAATNTPDIADGNASKGFFWVVTEAGSFLGESVQVGDSIIAKVDNAGASIGDWLILQGNVVIATDTVDGIVRLATQAEVDAGTEGGAVVLTPSTFANSIQLADITTNIVNLQNDKLSRDGSQTMTGDLDMGGSTIVNVATPTSNGDAANKLYVDDQAAAAQAAAEAYADSLAPNYDPAGSAATAESNANSYTDSAIAQEVTDRNSAIATAKSEAIADANTYTDTQIAAQSFTSSYANTDWVLQGSGIYTLDVTHNLNSSVPKVSANVNGSLVEFYVKVDSANLIQLVSNIAPPASVIVGVSK